jgi:hypothetical protein
VQVWWENPRHFVAVDGLRGFAAIVVLTDDLFTVATLRTP